ncbi:lipase maturation factor family protein [Agromyces sp. SYSU T0242]|uniref:lipase maturation factor family protein n=1 Tax=Agromyces litoreus TaxID=3158561 RepID=UPI003399EB41
MDWSDWFTWFDARDATVAREVLQRGIAAIFLLAFVSTLNQFRPLLGEHGLLPVPDLLRAVDDAERRRRERIVREGGRPPRFGRTRRLGYLGPTIFRRWGYTDARLVAVCAVGILLAASVVAGLPQLGPPWVPLVAFLAMWGLYLSIVSVGQTFYGFGWEMLLCEAGFLVAFLGSRSVPPPLPILALTWWLVFRLEFGAGMIKLRGDRAWRDLTALYYHHETQPMPGPLSRQAHLLPKWFHRLEVVGNHTAQLVVPFLLFAPQPVRSIAAAVIIGTQLWLVVTGNFAWLNWITIVLAFGAVGDGVLGWLLPWLPIEAIGAPPDATSPPWWVALVLLVTVLLAWLGRRPLRNLFSRRQLMNASFDRYLLANAYGAFGSVTRQRVEVIVEGTSDDPLRPGARWRAYGFKGKPGDPRRIPRQFAPYHLRLDWLMWFLPLGRIEEDWFLRLLERLLEADPATLKLLARDPFDGERPTAVRARTELYRFSTRAEHRSSGEVWIRQPLGVAIPPISMGEPERR